jgi:hypothetical protein
MHARRNRPKELYRRSSPRRHEGGDCLLRRLCPLFFYEVLPRLESAGKFNILKKTRSEARYSKDPGGFRPPFHVSGFGVSAGQ